jgi:TonB family protein
MAARLSGRGVVAVLAGALAWGDDAPANGAESTSAAETRPGPATSQAPTGGAEITEAFVTLAVMPRYPKNALKRGTDGEITLEFDISKHGRATNIEVVAESPRGVFDEETGETLQYWAFSPARLPDCGTTEQKARQTIVFDHDADPQIRLQPLVVDNMPQPPRETRELTLREYWEEQEAALHTPHAWDPRGFFPLRRVDPEYPTRALDRRKEGMVALAFLIGTDGAVSDVEVVDSVEGTYFQKPALSAIRQWRFKPRIKNGEPVDAVACHEFVFHVDEYERSGKLARERAMDNVQTSN